MHVLNTFLYLLNSLDKTLKNTGKLKKKYCKSHGKVREICQFKNVGTMSSCLNMDVIMQL